MSVIMRIQYKTKEERQKILDEQVKLGKVLIQEQNHLDGNFLIFADEYPEEKPVETTEQLIERKITELVKADSLKVAK